MRRIKRPAVLVIASLFLAGGGGGGGGLLPLFAAEEKKEAPLPAAPVVTPRVTSQPAPPAVTDVQRELQEIVRIHQALQAQHVTQIREIQRIMEQARLHQQLLKDLAPARAAGGVPVTPATRNVDELIRLQKIQLIQQQAAENRSRLEEIGKQETEAKVPQPPRQPEEVKKTSA
jgi:hypothetical protein